MRTCPKCKKTIENDKALFCRYCGHRLSVAVDAPPVAESEPESGLELTSEPMLDAEPNLVSTPKPEPAPKMEPKPEPKAKTYKMKVISCISVAVILVISILVYHASDIASVLDTDSLVEAPDTVETITVNGVSFRMIRVEGGTFMMGATSEQDSVAFYNEKPAHQVTLSIFSIGETEVTQELWETVMGSNPSCFKGSRRPVERVSWEDCQDFIRRLNDLTGRQFRLPTEEEWEYAARGGNKSQGYKYAGGNNIDDVAWYENNSGSQTHDVGMKRANELGLCDIAGNVWEWCQDFYNDYSSTSQPNHVSSSSSRVCRGGCWSNVARGCRVSTRSGISPSNRNNDLGLRLAL